MMRARFTVEVTADTLPAKTLDAIGARLIRAAKGRAKWRTVRVFDNAGNWVDTPEELDKARQRAAVIASEEGYPR